VLWLSQSAWSADFEKKNLVGWWLVMIAPLGGVVALLIAVVIVEVGVPWEN
jgi:hypothetical protein